MAIDILTYAAAAKKAGGDAKKLGGNFAEEYSAAKTYQVGEHCMKDGVYYVRSEAGAAGAWDATKWTREQVGDEISEQSAEIAEKQDKLIAGANITIAEDGKTISVAGEISGSDANAVHYNAADGKSDAEKAQARANIGAANSVDVVKSQFDSTRYDGKRLNDIFADADALHTAIAAGDFSQINVGDYWEITLNGAYRDYGNWTLPAGGTYYSDTACTTVAGTVAVDTGCNPNDANDYCELNVGGTKYCKIADVLKYRVKSLSNSLVKAEVAGINPYWRYGDSGTLTNATPHVCFVTRDGFGNSIKMRPSNQRWADEEAEEFEITSTTGAYTLTDATKKIRNIRINGVLKTYNTHYTVSGATVTLKAAAGAAVGDTLSILYTDDDCVWTHSSLFKTFNDADYGILKLMSEADTKLVSHMTNMRFYAETQPVTGSWGTAWANRGNVFLPLESEVWGANIYGKSLNVAFRPMLALFANGKKRSKGTSNGGGRTAWWVGSFYYATFACLVTSYDIAYSTSATSGFAAPLGFVVI